MFTAATLPSNNPSIGLSAPIVKSEIPSNTPAECDAVNALLSFNWIPISLFTLSCQAVNRYQVFKLGKPVSNASTNRSPPSNPLLDTVKRNLLIFANSILYSRSFVPVSYLAMIPVDSPGIALRYTQADIVKSMSPIEIPGLSATSTRS